MSAVADLEASLQALLACKPPGVTKSRIASITTLCVENIKSESVLVQKIYTHFKRTPATHKLGVLYVVDSITREWLSKASAAGQDVNSSEALDGTFAAGLYKVTQFLPSLMNDLIKNAPEDQKDKITKLVGIWERGSIFPKEVLSGFQKSLETRPAEAKIQSPAPAPAQPALGPAEIFSALQQPTPTQVTLSTNGTATKQPHPASQAPSSLAHALQPSLRVSTTANVAPFNLQQMTQHPIAQAPMPEAAKLAAAAAATPSIPPSTASIGALAAILPPQALKDPQKLAGYLQILQQLVQMGVPAEQWPDVIAALTDQNGGSQATMSQPTGTKETAGPPRPGILGASINRDRSHSPNQRDSPGLKKNQRNPYRERSPTKSGSPSRQADKISINQPKLIEFDPSLPPDHIKVLSRTLFVGGTTCPDYELGQIFSAFGNVQSVITNNQKRHAFVKMCTRVESVAAKQGMDNLQDEQILSRARSTKWGVGFGPRECCDYTQGVSVIPISRLTDADHRWILTAEYGGIGGREITSGMVMEEPDIEIGAGVSSKAISNRVGGNEFNNNRRGRGGRFDRPQRFHQEQQYQHQHQQQPQPQPQYQQQPQPMQFPTMPQMPYYQTPPGPQQAPRYDEMNGIGAAPAVPGFGFQMPAGFPGLPPFGR